MVKAGFILQMCGHEIGCIDSHNVREYDISEAFLRRKNTQANCEKYIQMCEDIGGSEYMWDEWCKTVAERQPTKWGCPDMVSAMHLHAIDEGYRHDNTGSGHRD
jgi:hypothetical protein